MRINIRGKSLQKPKGGNGSHAINNNKGGTDWKRYFDADCGHQLQRKLTMVQQVSINVLPCLSVLDRQGEALQPSTADMPFPCSAERAFGEPSHKQTVEHPP